MRSPARSSLAFVALALIAGQARAATTDALALERLPKESAWSAAFAYERACLRMGAEPTFVRPLATFDFDGRSFVRIAVMGDDAALGCLRALESRQSLDGNVRWVDGSDGALLLPDERKVPPLSEGYVEEPVIVPSVERALVSNAARGDSEALEQTKALPLPDALVFVEALSTLGATALPALETVATTHPEAAVRRAATLRLDRSLSFDALVIVATKDTAWEVRHAAVSLIALASASPLAQEAPHGARAEGLLRVVLQNERSAFVRRQAVWMLPSTTAEALSPALLDRLANDVDAQVRAAALETLAAIDRLPRARLLDALHDSDVVVRGTAVHVLTVLFDERDAPLLWSLIKSSDRPVRLAALPMLRHIRTEGLGPSLWSLFEQEADGGAPNDEGLRVLADALARARFEALPELLEWRLDAHAGDDELLLEILAQVAPKQALLRLQPAFDSPNARERALAARVAPDTAETRERRIELLHDADAEVRAAATLGLCGIRGMSIDGADALAQALPESSLGAQARQALLRCGEAAFEPPRARVRLEPSTTAPALEGLVPASAALLLLLASVLALKLSRPPT